MKSKYLLVVIFLLVAAAFLVLPYLHPELKKSEEAFDSYTKGEKAKTIAERKDAFNKALALYLDLEKEGNSEFSNGKLYFNIGNTYFQLSEYAMAILYYERALALMPNSEKVRHNLAIARDKLGIVEKSTPSILQKIFFFHSDFSLPLRLQIFFWLSVIGYGLWSAYLWAENKPWIKRGMIIIGILCSVFLISLGYSRYISPMEGVIVKATNLYRDAGTQYATVLSTPITSGNKVEILNIQAEGKWLKVLTSDGNIGFVPSEAIRVI